MRSTQSACAQGEIKKISFSYKTTQGLSCCLRLSALSYGVKPSEERQNGRHPGDWNGAPNPSHQQASSRGGRHQTVCGRAQKHNLIQEAHNTRWAGKPTHNTGPTTHPHPGIYTEINKRGPFMFCQIHKKSSRHHIQSYIHVHFDLWRGSPLHYHLSQKLRFNSAISSESLREDHAPF